MEEFFKKVDKRAADATQEQMRRYKEEQPLREGAEQANQDESDLDQKTEEDGKAAAALLELEV